MLEQVGTGLRCQQVAGPPHSLHHLSVLSWSRPQQAGSLHLRATLSRATAQHLSSVSYADKLHAQLLPLCLVQILMRSAAVSANTSVNSPFSCWLNPGHNFTVNLNTQAAFLWLCLGRNPYLITDVSMTQTHCFIICS